MCIIVFEKKRKKNKLVLYRIGATKKKQLQNRRDAVYLLIQNIYLKSMISSSNNGMSGVDC